MKIKAYLKPQCGWSNGVRAILRKHNLPFEDIDIINNRANYAEMVQKSGQPLSPCVEVDGVMLADVSGEEVENYLLSNDLVKPTDVRDRCRRPTRVARMRSTPKWPRKRSASSKKNAESTPQIILSRAALADDETGPFFALIQAALSAAPPSSNFLTST